MKGQLTAMKEKMKRLIAKTSHLFVDVGVGFLGFVYSLLGVVTLIVFLFVLSFLIAYIKLMISEYDSFVLKAVCRLLYGFTKQPLTIDAMFIQKNSAIIKELMEYIISISVAVSSLLLSIIACFSFFKKDNALKDQVGIRKYILSSSSDGLDLEVMNRYYKGADKVVIYSSTFQWLVHDKGTNIKQTLEKVDDVTLVRTGKNSTIINQVNEALKDSSLLTHFIEKPSNDPKRFSFVKKRNRRHILYLQDVSNTPFVIVFSENINTTMWLEAFESVFEDFVNNTHNNTAKDDGNF